jgi:hypothetical protein
MIAGATLRPVLPAAVDAHRTGGGVPVEPVFHPTQRRRGRLDRSDPAALRQPGDARSGPKP